VRVCSPLPGTAYVSASGGRGSPGGCSPGRPRTSSPWPDEIALTDSRLQDLLGRVDSGESGRVWRELKAAWTLFKQAREAGDPEGMRLHLVTLESLLNRGVADYAAWEAVHKQLGLIPTFAS
jgi:hypothetical protein